MDFLIIKYLDLKQKNDYDSIEKIIKSYPNIDIENLSKYCSSIGDLHVIKLLHLHKKNPNINNLNKRIVFHNNHSNILKFYIDNNINLNPAINLIGNLTIENIKLLSLKCNKPYNINICDFKNLSQLKIILNNPYFKFHIKYPYSNKNEKRYITHLIQFYENYSIQQDINRQGPSSDSKNDFNNCIMELHTQFLLNNYITV